MWRKVKSEIAVQKCFLCCCCRCCWFFVAKLENWRVKNIISPQAKKASNFLQVSPSVEVDVWLRRFLPAPDLPAKSRCLHSHRNQAPSKRWLEYDARIPNPQAWMKIIYRRRRVNYYPELGSNWWLAREKTTSDEAFRLESSQWQEISMEVSLREITETGTERSAMSDKDLLRWACLLCHESFSARRGWDVCRSCQCASRFKPIQSAFLQIVSVYYPFSTFFFRSLFLSFFLLSVASDSSL